MKHIKKIISSFIISTALFANIAFAQEIVKDQEYFDAVKEYILLNYAGHEISEQDLYDGAIHGMFDKLDPHSVYMDKPSSQSFSNEMKGKMCGIGVKLSIKNKELFVSEVLSDSPAKKVGILNGDKIVKVNDVDIKDSKNPTDLIKGERESLVKITVIRNNQTLDFDIIRDEIKINPVSYEILSGNIGYIKMSEFNNNISIEVDKVVKEFKSKDIKKVILDLRGNPGGSLREVINVSDYFVPRGNVVSVKYKNGNQNTYQSAGINYFEKVAVLVDDGSASASEILAGAIKDTKSGTLIGKTTYGKGSVQDVFELVNGESIKLTKAKYYLPSGICIDKIGIAPDIDIDRFEQSVDKNTFVQIQRNLQLGDAGLDVLSLQDRLKILGYDIKDAKGIFSDSTCQIIKGFQSVNTINPTGIVDEQTASIINQKFTEKLLSKGNDKQLKKAIEILSK